MHDQNENTQPDYVKLEAEVRDIVPYSLELFRKKDLEGLVNRFAADGALKNFNSPILTGIDAIRESYKGALQLQDFKRDLKFKKWISQKQVIWLICFWTVHFPSKRKADP